MVENGTVVGCAALHVYWKDLSELKSVAVDEAHQGKNIGGKLINRCIEEAKELGIKENLCLNLCPQIFSSVTVSQRTKGKLTTQDLV